MLRSHRKSEPAACGRPVICSMSDRRAPEREATFESTTSDDVSPSRAGPRRCRGLRPVTRVALEQAELEARRAAAMPREAT